MAKLAGVSVRALRHYDAIGLVRPSGRSEAGYRLYTDADLERLHTVLFYRELEFPLDGIRRSLEEPGFDRREALKAQGGLVRERMLRLQRLLGHIDRTIASLEGGRRMSKEEMFEVFGDFDATRHEGEAEERWGDSDAYRESMRRTARYTVDDWKRYKAELDESMERMAALMDEGVPPTDPRAMDAAEQARLLIDSWFYPCSRAMHAALGQMYVADPRFAANYDKVRQGMAAYVCEATAANLAREASATGTSATGTSAAGYQSL